MKHLAFVLLMVATACKSSESKPQGQKRGEMRFPVATAPVESRRVEYRVEAVGSVAAFERVQVAARIPGAVDKVRFVEGAIVKEGQPLVDIEPERYRIALRVAGAVADRAQAGFADAEAGLLRRQKVLEQHPDLIPAEELESWRTKAAVAQAELAEAKARLAEAEMNLRYASPSAPVSGVIETRSVETGEYVAAGKLLATLVRRDPLLLKFNVPERDAARLTVGQPAQFTTDASTKPYSAKLTHVGQAADATSRMVAVTAEVDDGRKDSLRPGSFAEVSIPVGASDEATVIPYAAVRPSERGFVVYVVESDVAHERVVDLGLRTGDGGVEIRSGLKAGDVIVVRGGEALSDGAKVRIDDGATTEPARAAATEKKP